MAVKFMTIKGASTIATKPFYIGIPQHERVIGKKEAYEIAAERTSSRSRARISVPTPRRTTSSSRWSPRTARTRSATSPTPTSATSRRTRPTR